jgi:hypothetical protein
MFPPDFSKPPSKLGYEIQINSQWPDRYPTGSIYGLASAETGLQNDGEWNAMNRHMGLGAIWRRGYWHTVQTRTYLAAGISERRCLLQRPGGIWRSFVSWSAKDWMRPILTSPVRLRCITGPRFLKLCAFSWRTGRTSMPAPGRGLRLSCG